MEQRARKTRPAPVVYRDGGRGRRLGTARVRLALTRERPPRHRVVLRAGAGRDRRPRGRQDGPRANARCSGRLGSAAATGTTRRPSSGRRSRRSGAPGSTRWPSSPPMRQQGASTSGTANGNVMRSARRPGKRRWTRQIPPPLATSPALDDRRVYVSSLGGVVLALRRRTASASGATASARAPSPRRCSSTARSTSAPRTAR